MENMEGKVLPFDPEKKRDKKKEPKKTTFWANEPSSDLNNVILFHESVRLRRLDKKFAELGKAYEVLQRRFEFQEERPAELLEKVAALDVEFQNFLEEVEKIWTEIEMERLDFNYELSEQNGSLSQERQEEIREELLNKEGEIEAVEHMAHLIQQLMVEIGKMK